MANFERIVDNRYRPDFESSRRRVRQEEKEPFVFSRELSFVPSREHKKFEPHDAQTRALIRRNDELSRLPHGERVSTLLEKWAWMDRMQGPEEKQRFLEDLIETCRRDPDANEGILVFLMVVFEPVRRSVSKVFIDARAGLMPKITDVSWSNRSEARFLEHIERQDLFDVTREAALEAVFRYPSPPPDKFFPWLRETVAHHALNRLRGDLPEVQTTVHNAAEAAALQHALAGFDQAGAPRLSDRPGLRAWRQRIAMRDVFDVVEEFFEHDPVREACRTAIGRLPKRQRDVIDGYFFQELEVGEMAERRRVSTSTVYNQKAQAQSRLHDDDVFFSALHSVNRVRDEARARSVAAAYPSGRMPDGRRIVLIDAAA
jgi:RNA polymerase sigma factor (sigma-70 family)